MFFFFQIKVKTQKTKNGIPYFKIFYKKSRELTDLNEIFKTYPLMNNILNTTFRKKSSLFRSNFLNFFLLCGRDVS